VLITVVVTFTVCLNEKFGKIIEVTIISDALNIYANYAKDI